MCEIEELGDLLATCSRLPHSGSHTRTQAALAEADGSSRHIADRIGAVEGCTSIRPIVLKYQEQRSKLTGIPAEDIVVEVAHRIV